MNSQICVDPAPELLWHKGRAKEWWGRFMALISLIGAVNWGGGQGECRVQLPRAGGGLRGWCWLLPGLFHRGKSTILGGCYSRVSSRGLAASP